jgi:transcriptional regulator with XRE-family HTH domain
MEAFYRDFGRLLARTRRDHGLSQQLLGERVSLSRTSIVNVEKGRQRVPLHLLIDMAAALGVEPAALLPERSSSGDENLPRGLQGMDEASQAWVLRQIQPTVTDDEIEER